ncbi:MAG TPA: hypothetical protein VFE78_24015 [Gemmataceae bacterium]|jgi:hypothetical protein|nr:hypothetical protein [Gemmataceae bacterium]
MSSFSHCVECNGRLRNAFFCPHCGAAACSWRCYDRHRSGHAPVRAAPAAPSANGKASPPAR